MAKIGLIQVDLTAGADLYERQERLLSLAEKCYLEGADLVFFPEAYQHTVNRAIISNIDALKRENAKWREKCAALAKKHHAYIVPWDYIEDKGKVYNGSYILDRNGCEAGRYYKCNLTVGEIGRIANGMEYPVFELDFGRVGIMICFDNYFPEVAASLGAKGAQLILYPLFGDTLKPQWEQKLRARAIDHSVFVASCQIDSKYDYAYTGMVNKEGEVIAKLSSPESYTVVDIDLDEKVLTNTGAAEPRKEDLREYLHKCRNHASYTSLSEQGTVPLTWEEIYVEGTVPAHYVEEIDFYAIKNNK